MPSLHKAKTNGDLAHKFVKFSRFGLAHGLVCVPSGGGSPIWEIYCTFLEQSDSFSANYAVGPGWGLRNVPGVCRTGQ